MAQIQLKLQSVTPLLMYGAANKDDSRLNPSIKQIPEFRASAIRGILRYWLRAVNGSLVGRTSELFEREKDVFGSTDSGSRVKVRVNATNSQIQSRLNVLPAQTKGYRLEHTGFPSHSKFTVTLSTHPLDGSGVLDAESPLVKALLLTTQFGGIGRRSRRGSGNLQILDVNSDVDGLQMPSLSEDRDALATQLVSIAQFVCPPSRTVARRPAYPVFASDTAVVLLSRQTHASIDDAFDELWSVSGPYHKDGGIFGDMNPRRASAIHMRVALTRSNEYVSQQTILYSGNGNWDRMKAYIAHCQSQTYDVLYGTWGH
jgi:CRISPR type III-B/RAMP module RAMP protein Cmr1